EATTSMGRASSLIQLCAHSSQHQRSREPVNGISYLRRSLLNVFSRLPYIGTFAAGNRLIQE
ncbi:MAG: hypothetical protein AAFX51_08125, partial [Cyanobacteria bacterium J06636_28]